MMNPHMIENYILYVFAFEFNHVVFIFLVPLECHTVYGLRI